MGGEVVAALEQAEDWAADPGGENGEQGGDEQDATRAGGNPFGERRRLLEAGMAYIAFARTYPERYALIFGTVEPLPTTDVTSPDGKSAAGGEAFEYLVALVLANLPTGDPRREEAENLARGIWSGLHGFVMLRYCRPAMGWPSDRDFATRLASAWLGEPPAS